jgi:hypothetical protein
MMDVTFASLLVNFNPPVNAEIVPGQSSDVLVISTNATQFTAGNASVIDGGAAVVASFEPTGTIPEPAAIAASVLLAGLLIRRRISLTIPAARPAFVGFAPLIPLRRPSSARIRYNRSRVLSQ